MLACMHACLLACDCDCWNQCHVISFVEVWPRGSSLFSASSSPSWVLGALALSPSSWHLVSKLQKTTISLLQLEIVSSSYQCFILVASHSCEVILSCMHACLLACLLVIVIVEINAMSFLLLKCGQEAPVFLVQAPRRPGSWGPLRWARAPGILWVICKRLPSPCCSLK